MEKTTTIRIDRSTHEHLKALADRRRSTVAETVARGVRLLRQEEMGRAISRPLDQEEKRWLDAELG